MSLHNSYVRLIYGIQASAVAGLLIVPLVATEYWRFFAFQVVVMAYLTLSFEISYSYARILSFMHAVFFAVGAYSAALLISDAAWSLPLVVMTGIVGAAILAAVFGFALVRMKNHNPTVATVIIVSIIYLAGNAFSSFTGGDDGLLIQRSTIGLAGAQIGIGPVSSLYYLATCPLLVLLVGRLMLEKRLVWKVMRAVASNDLRAGQLGFDVKLRRLLAFVASASIAGFGGAIYALMMRHVSTHAMDIALSIDAILYAVVGGIGTAFGPLIGVMLIYPFTEVASLYVSSVPILVGILLTFVSLFAPRGFMGSLSDLASELIDADEVMMPVDDEVIASP